MSCDCNLKYTSWLNDLVPPNDSEISFNLNLQSLMNGFDPVYSGIWQPLILNEKKFDNKMWLDTNANQQAHPIVRDLLGYEKAIVINNPKFQNWNVDGKIDVCVDIGMKLRAPSISYSIQGAPDNNTQQSDFSSIQTTSIIRNKLNDEKITDEDRLSVNGLVNRVDPESSVVKTEVITKGKTFGLDSSVDLISWFSTSMSSEGLQWRFNGNAEKLKYLSTSDYLILDYTVFTEKKFPGETTPRTGQYSIRIALFGQNDRSPPIVVADTGSNTVDLSETSIPVTSGYITIRDEDLSQDVYAYVKNLSISGNTNGLRSSIDELKSMLVFNKGKLRDSIARQKTVQWTFNAGSENFNYLSGGESLVLTYNLYIYDNLGKYTEYTKTITILGKNEAPSVGVYSIEDKTGGIYNLNFPQNLSGKLSWYDPDLSDSVSASVLSVGVKYSILGLVSGFHNAFKDMLSVSTSGSSITWQFNPDTDYFKYLGQGAIVELNYVIEVVDSRRAKAYGLVTIVVVGNNEGVETNLDDIDKIYDLKPPVTPTEAIIEYDYFTISDNNTSDLINISILDYKYELTNVSRTALPKSFDVSHMLFFLPNPNQQRKNSFNKSGNYIWIFNTYPEHFRFLNAANKSIKITYRVLITDSAGSYKIKTLSFQINGYAEPQPDTSNPFNTPNRYNEYIFGWYRYYEMGKPNDNRYITGVDFYFGYVDTYLDNNGSSSINIPEFKDLNITPNNTPSYYNDPAHAPIRLIQDNNSLKQYFTNDKERLRALDIINSSPYIDMLTHKLIDIDALDYERDDYGRILPLLRDMSCKPFKDATAGRFASTKQDIFYRLAQKYGLSMLVDEAQKATLKSTFLSDVGPNVLVKYNHYIEKNISQTDRYSFADQIIKVGDIKYSYQFAKKDDQAITIDLNSIKNIPVLPLIDNELIRIKQGASFNIIEKRLNDNVYNYSLVSRDGGGFPNTESTSLMFHGHGGSIDNANKALFVIGYEPKNTATIETTPSNIEITFYSNEATRTFIGDINIEYLRTPKRPNCKSFAGAGGNRNARYSLDDTYTYDFSKDEYTLGTYAPSFTNYYIPDGYYYANLTNEEKNKLGIDLYDHPNPQTPFLKTHDLKVLNPLNSASYAGRNDILELSRKGTFTIQTDVSDLDSGHICLAGITSSGIFNLYLDGKNISSTYDFTPGRFIMCLENIAKESKNVKLSVDVADECDYSYVKLTHTPHANFSNPLISKIEVPGSIGFFHPNYGWKKDPKYHFKSPMAPYCPAPLTTQQSEMVNNKKMMYNHYFWYDNEKMYNTDYLDGFNFMFNMTSINKTIIDNIQKSRFIGIKKDDYYLMTHEFYKFVYNADESPIKQSVRMSYLDIDYSYGYPFNDFRFTVISPTTIMVNSDSNKQRVFSYFDDAILQKEKIELFDHEILYINNSKASVSLAIAGAQNNIEILNERIQYWTNQRSFTRDTNEINRINSIIQNLISNIQSINQTISSLTALLTSLNEKSIPFKTTINTSYGDNESLILHLDSSLPQYLLDGGYVRKDLTDIDRSRSYIIYRSNVARNDFELKVNKWGNIISGKDLDEYNNSILRQKNWQQSSLFLNQNDSGAIESSGYYFPYSYGTNIHVDGNKKYEIRFRQANPILGLLDQAPGDQFIETLYEEKKDYGNISYTFNKVPANIYLGPYKGPVFVSTAPRLQKGEIEVDDNDYLNTVMVFTTTYQHNIHNLKGGDSIRFESADPINSPLSQCCLEQDTTYFVIRRTNSFDLQSFIIGSTPTEPVFICDNYIPNTNVFLIADNSKFNYDNPCLGKLEVKYNNSVQSNKFNKEEKPLFAKIQHTNRKDDLYKYLPYLLSPLTARYIEGYNKFIGAIPGEYYAYIDDPLTKQENGFIKTNRYGLYNHNDNIIYKYYTNANGTSASPINKPAASGGPIQQGLLERYRQDNNDLIDSVIRSLYISIDTLNEDIVVLSSFLSDTSKTQEEKLQYINQIDNLNNKISLINQNISYINDLRVNNPVIDDNNYKKLPLTYNLNIPSKYYNSNNPFLDINIFGTDPRTKPTLVNGRPAVSGYVYFEGLVEPPLSDFYNHMELPYNNNLWIDIPENANFSIMTKYGQIFNSPEEYSILLQRTTECDENIRNVCQEQYSEDFCGNIDHVNGGNVAEFFKTIGINNYEEVFDTKIINLPLDCASLDLCCDTMLENDIPHRTQYYRMRLNYHSDIPGWTYPSLSVCQSIENNTIKQCEKQLPEYNLGCLDHNCPIKGSENSVPAYFSLIGTLKNDNLDDYNFMYYTEANANGVTRSPLKNSEAALYPEVLYPGNFNTNFINVASNYIDGKIKVKSQKILLFKIKKINLKNIMPSDINSLSFINDGQIYSSNSYDSIFSNTYVGGSGLPNKLDAQTMVYPTESAGLISYSIDPDYVSKNRHFQETFKTINNSERYLLKPNSNSIIWRNEINYRNLVSYVNKINGPLYEYDIMCYGAKNPYFLTAPINIGAITPSEAYREIKELYVKEGELYEITIYDDNDVYTIKAYIVSCGAGLCFEHVMNLGEENITIDYEMSNSVSISDIFSPDPGCQQNLDTTPNPPDPAKYQDIELLYSLTRRAAGTYCSKCPEHFFYCGDKYITYDLKEVEVDVVGKDPPWNITSKNVDTGKIMTREGSRETCIATDEGRAIGSFFRYAPHPDNYETFKQQIDFYLAYPINCKDLYFSQGCDCEVFVGTGSKIAMKGYGFNGTCKNTDDTFEKSMPALDISVYHNIITINNFYIMRKSESRWLLPKITIKLLNKDISLI